MVEAIGPAGADDAEVIGMFCDAGQPVGHPDPTLPVLFEDPFCWHEGIAGRAHRRQWAAERFGHRLTRQLLQHRLGIKEVKVTRAALHEKPDDGFGRRGTARQLRGQRIQRIEDDIFRSAGKPVQAQQVAEGERAEAASGPLEEFAAGAHWLDVQCGAKGLHGPFLVSW